MKIITTLIMALTILSTPWQAVNAASIAGVVGGALTVGGDTVGRFNITYNGEGTDVEDIDAGDFMYAFAGIDVQFGRPGKMKTGVLTTVGYHWTRLDFTNGNASFDRVPVDVMYYVKPDILSFGVGATYHLSPTYEVQVTGTGGKFTFEDSLGFFVEAGIAYTDHSTLTLRYTAIDYDFNLDGVEGDISGNNIGIGFRFGF